MDIKNRNVNVWFVAAVLLVVSGVAFGARIGQYIYTDRLYKGNGELIWNFANGDLPVSGATVIVSKGNDGYTYVRWWNGTVLYKSNDGHDDDDIQAAIDAVAALGGGKVLIREGSYDIYNPIIINSSFIVLEGENVETTKLIARVDLNDTMIKITGSGPGTANHVSQVVVQYMTIYGSDKVANGVLIKYAHECTLRKLRISHFNGYGIRLQACWDSRFLELNVDNCGSTSNYALESMATSDPEYTNHCEFISCKFSARIGSPGAVYLTQGTHAMKFIGCKFMTFEDGTYGVHIENQAGYDETRTLIFSGCHFTQDWYVGSTSIGLYMPSGKDVVVSGCFFSGYGYGVWITSSVGRVSITGCNFYNPVGIKGGNRIVVSGCYFSGNTKAFELGGNDVVIVGNQIINSKQRAIEISNAYRFTIVGNYIKDYSIESNGTYEGIYAYNLRDSIVSNNLIQNVDYVGSYSIKEFGSEVYNNVIEGNVVNEPIYSIGNNTILKNNIGYRTENSGVAIVANGDYIAHGLVSTPTRIILTANYTQPVHVQVISENSTHFQVGIWNATGSPVTTPIPIYWEAMVE